VDVGCGFVCPLQEIIMIKKVKNNFVDSSIVYVFESLSGEGSPFQMHFMCDANGVILIN